MSPPRPTLDDLRIERGARPRTVPTPRVVASIVVFAIVLTALAWMLLRTRPVEVKTATAREVAGASDRTVLNASGYVTARRQATVSSKVTGKVVEVLIEEGMRVEAGQVLARLDDSNVRANLQLAEAQLDSARTALDETRAQLRQAELELQRASELAGRRIVSQADLDRAEAEVETLRARLARQERDVTVAERQVSVWQQQLEDLIIRAPFAGVVTTKDAQPGEMISPVSAGGGYTRTGIGTIVDMDSLEIEVDVNESYINRIEPGQPVEAALDAYPEWKIPCTVVAIVPTADRQKSTVKVRVGFDKLDPRILPEMSVKVAFHGIGNQTARRAVAIPKSTVQKHNSRDVVFVVRNGRVERRTVTVTGVQGEDFILGAGVAPGEKLVLMPRAGLTDGAAVRETKP